MCVEMEFSRKSERGPFHPLRTKIAEGASYFILVSNFGGLLRFRRTLVFIRSKGKKKQLLQGGGDHTDTLIFFFLLGIVNYVLG